MTVSKQLSNSDLMTELDKTLWAARGGSTGVLAVGTLRQALEAAAAEVRRGRIPGPIMKEPNDVVVIGHEQMRQLWNLLEIVV